MSCERVVSQSSNVQPRAEGPCAWMEGAHQVEGGVEVGTRWWMKLMNGWMEWDDLRCGWMDGWTAQAARMMVSVR